MADVLIVDDEENIRNGLSNNLGWKSLGVDKVYLADSAIMALEVLKEHVVALVITDVKMPAMSGLDFIERAKMISPEIKFIILSGYAEFYYVKRAMKLHVIDYLLKPVNLNELMTLLEKHLGRAEHEATSFEIISANMIGDRKMSPMVRRCIKYIVENYSKPITLDGLADLFERNPSYISYIFRQETGLKLFDYIAKVRVERAKELLRNSSLTINEIALQIGFEEYRSFVRVFKRETGLTPNEFMKTSKGQSKPSPKA